MHIVLFPKQRNRIKVVVLNRVCISRIFCSKIGSGFETLSGSPVPKFWSSTPWGVRLFQLLVGARQWLTFRFFLVVEGLSFYVFCLQMSSLPAQSKHHPLESQG